MKYVLILAIYLTTPNGDQDPTKTLQSVTVAGGFGTLTACKAAGNQVMAYAVSTTNSSAEYKCLGDGNR